jgi:ATP-dependent Clp protease ATP-binding subunit ClpA
MSYLSWHYCAANKFILKVLGNYLSAAWHFFSISILLKSLLAPWRRTVERKTTLGFSFEDFFQRLTFNFISRLIGFFVRLLLITWGLISLLMMLLIGLVILVVWQSIFILSLPLYWLTNAKSDQEQATELLEKYKDPASILMILVAKPIGKLVIQRLELDGKEIVQLIGHFSSSANALDLAKIPAKPGLDDLLFIIARDWLVFNKFLFDRQIKPEDMLAAARWFETSQEEQRARRRFWERENLVKGPGLGWNFCFGYTPALDKYVTDLTQPTPFFHQLVGRVKEVSRIEEILARRGENNVLLVGAPGVGKHTIVLGFARRVYQGQIKGDLAHKRVLEINLNEIIQKAGPAEAKSRVATLMEEAQTAGNIILVVDNIHQFAANTGTINLTDVFAHTAGGEKLQLIGITTPADFAKSLEGNDEFLKIFEKVEVAAPDKDEALRILTKVLPDFEKGKNVCFSYQSLRAIINLSDKLISDIPFPEKAIDLVDQLASKYESKDKIKVITAEEVNQLVEEKTKVPVGTLKGVEQEKLKNLESELAKRVIGQQGALSALASAMRRSRLGITSAGKPIGSFLFLGPTGVGKTETAKALASIYFGNESRMVRFEMSQYGQQESLDNLLGSVAAGPGLLVEKIKDNPYSVLLLDELEKAHPKLLNIFLTVFDEGYLTDYRGKKVSFTDTIAIATSNAAAEFIREQVSSGAEQEKLQQEVIEYIQKHGIFAPEFLNRFDGIIVFKPLSESELEQVAGLQLASLAARLKQKDIELVISPELVKSVSSGGYSQEFGARPMKRFIADKIEDVIAKAMLDGKLKRGDKVNLRWDPNREQFSI